MSSAINIWDPAYAGGIPQTFEQADAIFQKFDSNELVGVNPKFIQFAEVVTRIVATELDVQEDIQDSFDSLVAASQRNQMALFRVGLPNNARVLGIEIVVRAAVETGLIAFDESMCAVFLPDGSVQPPDKAEMWFGALDYMRNPEEEYPLKIKDFKKLFLANIAQLVEKNGMTKAKLSFVNSKGYCRQCGNVTQYLSTDVEGGGGVYRIKIYIYIFFEPINEIYKQFSFMPSEYVFSLIVPEELNQYRMQFRYLTNSVELKSFMQMLEQVVFSKILDVAKDIQGLDQLMNPESDEIIERRKISIFYYPQRLIAARLAGNPRFELLVEEYGQANDFGANNRHKETEWPKLVQYLREEVKPIV